MSSALTQVRYETVPGQDDNGIQLSPDDQDVSSHSRNSGNKWRLAMSASALLASMFTTASARPPITSIKTYDNTAVKEWKLSYGFPQDREEKWDDEEQESPNWLGSRIKSLASRGFQRINAPQRRS